VIPAGDQGYLVIAALERFGLNRPMRLFVKKRQPKLVEEGFTGSLGV
jgi:hypothetical protein